MARFRASSFGDLSLNRRSAVFAGSLAVPGLSLKALLHANTLSAPVAAAGPSFGRAKNIIFLYLAGGPPQHETFDPKPNAPAQIRGPFKPISTNIPGIQFCELLPRTAAMADKLAVVRSMATDDNVHSSSGAWVLTGYRYRGANARVISQTDWPYFGSLIKRLRPADRLPALSTVWLPDVMRLNENVTPSGQTAGFMGSQWNPEVFVGDPAALHYEIESLRATDVVTSRMHRRHELLSRMDAGFPSSHESIRVYDMFQQQAFDLLTSGAARQAFHVDDEPAAVRNRYGRNRWGQSVLLARRLVEAGVRLVHVQWPREPGDNAVDNPLWDTHAQNADRMEDVLCPIFDVGFSALIQDLHQRNLLDETLVVAIGEFGRTPKINAKGGRDHWGAVFSCVLAGAGISGGQVYGSSDADGGYPESNRVEPGDLTASMFHLLGLDYLATFPDRLGREHRLTGGEPLWDLLGDVPATSRRTESGGDVQTVPPFDPARHLAQSEFPREFMPLKSRSRPRGWRAGPVLSDPQQDGFGARIVPQNSADFVKRRALLGFSFSGTEAELSGPNEVLMAQQVRSPFAGTYRMKVQMRGEASSAAIWNEVFMTHFRCQLQFLRYKDQNKYAGEATVLAAIDFQPALLKPESDEWRSEELSKHFANPNPGSNFSFGSGLAVAVRLTKKNDAAISGSVLTGQFAHLAIRRVELVFEGKQVNENVTV